MPNTGVNKTQDHVGDSLTTNTGYTNMASWANRMLSPTAANDYGVPGQTAEYIAARMGWIPVHCTITGNAFAGTASISITNIDTPFLSTTADSTIRQSAGLLNGIPCLIERTVVSTVETYNVTPLNTTTAAVPAKSLFIPYIKWDAADNIKFLWLGRNNVPSQLGGLVALYEKIYDYISEPKRFSILGVLPATDEIIGTTSYNNIKAVNDQLAAHPLFKDTFIPSTPPTDEECDYIGYTKIPQDLIDRANGIFFINMHAPSDTVHLNDYGRAIYALREYRMSLKNQW